MPLTGYFDNPLFDRTIHTIQNSARMGKVWTCGVDAWKKSTRLPSLRHSRPEGGGFAAGSSPADASDRNARAVVQRIRISGKRSRREKGGGERDPKRGAFAVQRTAPFRCGATGRPLADRHPSVAARAGRPVHSRSPKSVDGPKVPQLSVSRTVLSALRPKPLYPCGEASPKYPPPAPDRRLFGTKNTEIGIRSPFGCGRTDKGSGRWAGRSYRDAANLRLRRGNAE